MEDRPSRLGLSMLLAGILVAAGCAIVYELLIGSTSALFLGGSVEQFSLTIGFFLFSMGLGSWFSRWIHANLLVRFIQVEIGLAWIGGSAVSILYALYTYTGHFRYGMLLLIVCIGTLIGLEIPLLTRILRQYDSLRSALANALSMDYCGSLFAAVLFPYLLLPFWGAMYTSVLTGIVNWAVGLAVLLTFRRQIDIRLKRMLYAQVGAVGAFLLALLVYTQPLVGAWESAMYEDPIAHQEQSAYQNIVLTTRGDQIRLYLDGHLQFASVDEFRYHEALVHPAMELAHAKKRVLVIGGGDGLTVREVLKYPQVEHVDLVDLDPAVTRLAARNPHIARINQNALNRQQVHITHADGFAFLQRDHPAYDVVLFDLPDPREEGLAKLYSREGYEMAKRLLAPGGVMVTQATSPYYARRAFWCIGKTMEAAGLHVVPYHLNVPSFGEWGFQLGMRNARDTQIEFSAPLRHVDAHVWEAMKVFSGDMGRIATPINRLDKPVLSRYYREDWSAWF